MGKEKLHQNLLSILAGCNERKGDLLLNVVEANDFLPGVTQSLEVRILAMWTRMSVGLDWCLFFGAETCYVWCWKETGVCRTCKVILFS